MTIRESLPLQKTASVPLVVVREHKIRRPLASGPGTSIRRHLTRHRTLLVVGQHEGDTGAILFEQTHSNVVDFMVSGRIWPIDDQRVPLRSTDPDGVRPSLVSPGLLPLRPVPASNEVRALPDLASIQARSMPGGAQRVR